MKKIIVIGASSGIGYELAKIFSQNNWEVGIAARRVDKLTALQNQIPNKSYIRKIDIAQPEQARREFKSLIEEMGGLDVLVIASGTGAMKPDWKREQEIIQVNAVGFVALANLAYDYFKEQGNGQIVGISSIMALRGTRMSTVYAATKAFVSSYMEGLRHRSIKNNLKIIVTDVRPGFVKTAMTKKVRRMFWESTPEKAATQIFNAILKKQNVVYITSRWRLIGWLFKIIPSWIHYRI